MPDYITAEERRMIDEAIEAGKVQKIPMHEYVTAKYQWDSKQNRLVLIEKQKPQILFSGAMNSGRDRINAFRKEAAEKRMQHLVSLMKDGATKKEIAHMLGVHHRYLNRMILKAKERELL